MKDSEIEGEASRASLPASTSVRHSFFVNQPPFFFPRILRKIDEVAGASASRGVGEGSDPLPILVTIRLVLFRFSLPEIFFSARDLAASRRGARHGDSKCVF